MFKINFSDLLKVLFNDSDILFWKYLIKHYKNYHYGIKIDVRKGISEEEKDS